MLSESKLQYLSKLLFFIIIIQTHPLHSFLMFQKKSTNEKRSEILNLEDSNDSLKSFSTQRTVKKELSNKGPKPAEEREPCVFRHLQDRKFVISPEKPFSIKTTYVGKFISRFAVNQNDDQKEFRDLVAKYFQKLGCELFAHRKFKISEEERIEPGFEFWTLPNISEGLIKVFKQKIFFETEKKVRYVLSFPKKRPLSQQIAQKHKLLDSESMIRKLMRISDAFKKQHPVHMIVFLEEPRNVYSKQKIEFFANQFISKIEMFPELRAICQGFTSLTADYFSLDDYMTQKAREAFKLERANQRREKEKLDQKALERRSEENQKEIRILLQALGVSSVEEAFAKHKG